MKRKIAIALSFTLVVPAVRLNSPVFAADEETRTEITYNYDGENHTRMMEKLDRGLVAVMTEDGIFLSWRMLGSESSFDTIYSSPDFDVYKNGQKIATVTDSTNYIDATGTQVDEYSIAVAGTEELCDPVTAWSENYISIPLVQPEPEDIYDPSGTYISTNNFTVADGSCGDLDGDGEYEIVIKWVSSEHDVGSPGDPAYSGTVRFAAYKLDGTKLWDQDINLGKNVYSSAHTVQFLVYDYDGDGKAEMMCQSSVGSVDALGQYVTKAADPAKYPDICNVTDEENETSDYRGSGIVFTGPEYLTVFNGETGEAMDTIDLPTARVSAETFGDNFGNRSNRFLGEVAYLDGETPSAVYWRGYYYGKNGRQRTSIAGVNFDGERLSVDYRFDTLSSQPGYQPGNGNYVGQGNHNLTCADVDDDGCDEVISGASCIEMGEDSGDGYKYLTMKWCTHLGHGDAMHIGNYDPTNPGHELFVVHEEAPYGMSLIAARTGEILYHEDAGADTGRGLMANTGMGGYFQVSGSSDKISNGGNDFTDAPAGIGNNFRIYWDGDIYEETLNHSRYTPQIYKWDGNGMSTYATFYGTTTVNGTKAVPTLMADLLGDWREELVLATKDFSELRIYTTTDKTEYKMPTLMSDPVYRSGVAAEQTAYNQPPHLGVYVTEEMFEPRITSLSIESLPEKLEYRTGTKLDTTGLVVKAKDETGAEFEVKDYSVWGFDSDTAGEKTVTVWYRNNSADFNVTIKEDNTIAIENCSETMYLLQSRQNQSKTIGDITYNVGARSDGGDGQTGFIIDNSMVDGKTVMRAQAGRFSTSNRQAYMVFDRAPEEYRADYDYTFESDIYFSTLDGKTESAGMIMYDADGEILNTVSVTELGLSVNTWYHYALTFANGAYTETITGTDGEVVSSRTLEGTSPLKRIDFIDNVGVGNYENVAVYFSGLQYYRELNVPAGPSAVINSVDGGKVNVTSVGANIVMYSASYDEEGVLTGIEMFEIEPSNEEITKDYELTKKSDKLFIWSGTLPLINGMDMD